MFFPLHFPGHVELQVHRDVGQGRDERVGRVRGAACHGDQPHPVPPAHGGHRGEDQETLLPALASEGKKNPVVRCKEAREGFGSINTSL